MSLRSSQYMVTSVQRLPTGCRRIEARRQRLDLAEVRSLMNRMRADRKLLKLKFETLTVAHGNPIHPRAHEHFAKLFSV